MSKTRGWLALAVVGAWGASAGCGGGATTPTPTPTPQEAVVILTAATFQALVLESPGVVLVDFYRPSCPACQSMIPIVEQIALDFAGRAVVGAVRTDTAPTLSTSQRIEAVPTFVFYRAGVEVDRQVGTITYVDLTARLEAALSAS